MSTGERLASVLSPAQSHNGESQMNKREQKQLARSGKPIIKLHTLGAAGHVTGSLNLVEVFERDRTTRFLLDVGLHLEEKRVDHENRLPRGLTPKDIDFIVISHAHIDHSGYLPKLVKDGFKGPAYVTEATRDLLEILLPDSGYLQEEEAKRKSARNRRRFEASRQSGEETRGKKKGSASSASESEARSVRPLYTQEEAKAALKYLRVLTYNERHKLADSVVVKLTEAGHILGAAVVNVEVGTGSDKRTICFSGNIGRYGMPLLQQLEEVGGADCVIVESTYGNRRHIQRDRRAHLGKLISDAHKRASVKDPRTGSGVILIPAFAVGRAQVVLDDIRQLMESGSIPEMPVFLDGRMSINATEVHRKHSELLNAETQAVFAAGKDPFKTAKFSQCVEWTDSERLQEPQKQPILIVGSSGMAAGGRIVSHLGKRLSAENNTVIFVGYQGSGTLGHSLVRFADSAPNKGDRKADENAPKTVNVQGKSIRVRATIEFMSDYSAHADYADMIRWMGKMGRKPKLTLLVHGDEEALAGFQQHIKERLRWDAVIPKGREVFDLS